MAKELSITALSRQFPLGHACGNAVFFGIHLEFLRGIDTSMIRVKNDNRGITLTYRLFDIAEKFKAAGICNGEER